MKVLFVLGSGVSFGAHPDTKEITDEILNGDSNAPYLWNFRHAYNAREEKRCVQAFLKLLQDEVLLSKDSCNYEDLYSISLKLANHECGYEQAPEIVRFRNYIYQKASKFHKFYKEGCYLANLPLAAICFRSCFFINETVRQLLSGPPKKSINLGLITDAITHLGAANVDIITLNHDLLLEQVLTKAKIPWTDGFENEKLKSENSVEFSSYKFRNTSCVRILKVHGGVDWYYAGSNEGGWKCWKIPNILSVEIENKISIDYENGQILTGSTTKALAYTKGTFGGIHCTACDLLKKSPFIVCSGYGWKDLPFNEMLRDWSKCHKKTQNVVIAPGR